MTQQLSIRHDTLDYRPAIDGLRALAVLAVFIFHLNHNWLPGGFVGVDVFFVLSGYLITSIIFKEQFNGYFSLRRFYQRRIARIFPAFFTVALITLALANFVYLPQDLASAGANLAAAAMSVANIKYMLQGNYFEISPDAQPFLHYWSLSVEEQFYTFFPLLLLLIIKYVRSHLLLILGSLFAISFLACAITTQLKPVWSFYLLPTRAWELLAGSLLAALHNQTIFATEARWTRLASVFSFGLIVLSLLLIREEKHFPGYWALLPVVGTVGLLIPKDGNRGVCEKLLATASLVLLGRISYSLYLWHWPVFSLVDYKMYLASEPVRLALKVCLSFLAAILSFRLIENPARSFLNHPKNMLMAYILLLTTLLLCVAIGIAVRKSNYINAEYSDVAKGGLTFNFKPETRSVILMGDSNGSMYGKVMKDICADIGCKLTVISVSAGDPLPSSNTTSNPLWLDSLAVVQNEKPDFLIFACNWESKLKDDKQKLALAVDFLKPHVRRLIILNQPPVLPENASRASIRQGAHPPFYENAEIRRHRTMSNDYLNRFNNGNISVIDIASHFETSDGEVLFLDEHGRQLYQDSGHLSGFGAEFIRSVLTHAVSPTEINRGHRQ